MSKSPSPTPKSPVEVPPTPTPFELFARELLAVSPSLTPAQIQEAWVQHSLIERGNA